MLEICKEYEFPFERLRKVLKHYDKVPDKKKEEGCTIEEVEDEDEEVKKEDDQILTTTGTTN